MANLLIALSVLFLIFSGYFQMLLGIASPLFHLTALLIIVISASVKLKFSKVEIFPLAILALISIYFLFWFSNWDNLSLEYIVKSWIFLLSASIISPVINYRVWRSFKVLFLLSLVPSLLLFKMGIDWSKTDSNYLTIGLVIGILPIVASLDRRMNLVTRLLFFVIFVVVSMSIGSRGSLLFSLFSILLFSKRFITVGLGLLSILSASYLLYINNVIRINSWLIFKLTRLFSSDFEEEPRYEIYSQVFDGLRDLPVFGYGFLPSIFLSTSWDDSLPFLESFILEVIYNYGVFGVAILIIYSRRLLRLSRSNKMLGAVLFYLFLNYSKSWSMYSGLVLILALIFSESVTNSNANRFNSSNTVL